MVARLPLKLARFLFFIGFQLDSDIYNTNRRRVDITTQGVYRGTNKTYNQKFFNGTMRRYSKNLFYRWIDFSSLPLSSQIGDYRVRLDTYFNVNNNP